jgi:TldD protein
VLDSLRDLMGVVPNGCSYAEARHEERVSEEVSVRNGRLERVSFEESAGVGVRVRSGGAWGFAATTNVSPDGLRTALRRALEVAQRQPVSQPRELAPVAPAIGHWETPCGEDPFAVSLDDKLELLFAAEAALRGDPRIVLTQSVSRALRTRKAFASTEGAACTQSFTETGSGVFAVAVADDELQQRSYPNAHGGNVSAAGWEHVRAVDIVAHAPRVAEEAVALLTAPVCPEQTTTLVLHSEQLALQIHESVGHALELDRMLLGEAAYAGTSWVAPSDLGGLRYGSPEMTIVADATVPGGLGSFAWDDEGVAGRRTTLVDGGLLQAALSDRESAAAIGLAQSGGCARADGFSRQPIVRMTNVSIEPGEAGSFEDLIADTDEGVYMETNRSWSIDDRRLQFQFATEVGHEIRGGELGRLLRNPSYAGVTPEFWGSLDAVCSPDAWELWGLTNCGKGEPGQTMAVSHGAAPARFRGVQVGVA